MTRILVQRGGSSSSNSTRASSSPGSSSSSSRGEQQALTPPPGKDEEMGKEGQENVDEPPDGSSDAKIDKSDDVLAQNFHNEQPQSLFDECMDNEDEEASSDSIRSIGGHKNTEKVSVPNEGPSCVSPRSGGSSPRPPPPPVPPPRLSPGNSNGRSSLGTSNALLIGSPKRTLPRPVVLARTSPTQSRPSSPMSLAESEGYNSADEQNTQNTGFVRPYDDLERERQFVNDIRRAKGFEVKRMVEDGNCLFRAIADQVYGDSEAYDSIRQMCIDYMEQERNHFSQFVTEGFTSYCKRKRRDKVYGNNVEIQVFSEMYNRPIHIYSYGTEPINIFHGSYETDTPPIRLSYHNGNHYNSLVDPNSLAIGAGLGYSSLRGRNVDKDQVKAAIKAQQDQQIDNALLAEGQHYSDLELTEKEIERMVMETSRVEYLAKVEHPIGPQESSTSGAGAGAGAEPSSSGARPSGSESKKPEDDGGVSSTMRTVLAMGFSYMQVVEAYSIFGDDVDSILCYLLETSTGSSRLKGKAAE